MDAELRPHKPEDFETLYQIDQACYPPGIAYSRRALRSFLRREVAQCSVAEAKGEIAGFIIVEASIIQGHIITLDVQEKFRRRGIGSQLLVAAEADLTRQGMECIELETATNNEPAVAFWRKHGYRQYGCIEDYYSNGSDALLMHKHFGRTRELDPI